MYKFTNLSNNPVTLSDGKMLASGDSRKLKAVGDADRKLEKRNWLSVVEEKEQPKDEKAGGAK